MKKFYRLKIVPRLIEIILKSLYVSLLVFILCIFIYELYEINREEYQTGDMARLIGGERFGYCYTSWGAYKVCNVSHVLILSTLIMLALVRKNSWMLSLGGFCAYVIGIQIYLANR